MTSFQVFLISSLVKNVLVTFILLTAVAYTVWLERKVVGRIQNRWGPTRVGPFGLLQPMADGVKFLLKEDLTPPHVYKPLFIAAPLIAVICALTSISVVPFGNSIRLFGHDIPLQITDLNIGLLIILGVTSIGVYGVALAGWSSNSKYSLLGGLRASAQMISYELSLGLSLVGVLILSGSFSLREIVEAQSGHFWGFLPKWNILYGGQLVAFFIYLTAAYAETNRIPFDLPEAEAELVAGYHTEYSAMLAGIIYERKHTYEISEMGGLATPMPTYASFFLFILLASVGLPLLNGFVGEFLVLTGAFQDRAIYGVLAATGVIWSACYLLWMYQRVFFGKVTHPENNSLTDLDAREQLALWPTAVAALVMGVAPLLWLNIIDPAVATALAPFAEVASKVAGQ